MNRKRTDHRISGRIGQCFYVKKDRIESVYHKDHPLSKRFIVSDVKFIWNFLPALNDGKPLGCVVIARRGHNRPITRVAVPAGMQACPKFRVSAASIKVPPDRQRSGASSLSPAGYGAHAVPGDTPGPFFLPCKRRWRAVHSFFGMSAHLASNSIRQSSACAPGCLPVEKEATENPLNLG